VYSDALPEGERIVEREGTPGVARVVYSRGAYADGVEAVHPVRRRVVRAPVDRLVVVGSAPVDAVEGVASWYERDGLVAAHPSLPIGTRVRVTGVASGRSVTVIIDDRGPYAGGRIIDLSDDAFSRIAPLSAGTAVVRIAW
ncbi:MAG TPA: RlpA-like double-psi beta-barrel domain-containing protein, partial [Actinomycetota bacterium]|nr:RlpA-like double-psi beta-barrel domain-containing protein [Actinomycetota bacterium]